MHKIFQRNKQTIKVQCSKLIRKDRRVDGIHTVNSHWPTEDVEAINVTRIDGWNALVVVEKLLKNVVVPSVAVFQL